MTIQVSPGVTTNNPEQWLTLAKERGRRLRAAVEAGEASAVLLARWDVEIGILTAEIKRVTEQLRGGVK